MNASFGARLSFWRVVLITLLAFGLYAAVTRFAYGLGATTSLSDRFPWGLWIGFDILVGVALAAGGFTIAATVHLFHLKRYEPIARPAVLTAFLGYLLVIAALTFDLGKPWNVWHPLVMWNPHSVMFEVGWCVMLYTTVLALEFSPVVFERFGWKRPLRLVRAAYVPLVVVGVLLSMMHQSSLGTLFVILPGKLHGLWYTPLLPVFFFITAAAAGLAMTIVESFLSNRAFGKRLEDPLLAGLARPIVVILGIYVVWKAQDLAARGNLGLAFQLTPESVMFWGEVGLGALLPMALFASPKVRQSREALFFAALLTVLGLVLGRLNVALTGMAGASGVSYFPSWQELAVTACIVAMGFVLFALAVKHLPIFARHELEPAVTRPAPVPPTASRFAVAALWALLAVGATLTALASIRAAQSAPAAAQAAPPRERARLELPKDYEFPRAPDSPGAVTFRHDSHVDASAPACATCHDTGFSLLGPGRPLSGKVTMKRLDAGELCGTCHNGDKAFSTKDSCDTCHP